MLEDGDMMSFSEVYNSSLMIYLPKINFLACFLDQHVFNFLGYYASAGSFVRCTFSFDS